MPRTDPDGSSETQTAPPTTEAAPPTTEAAPPATSPQAVPDSPENDTPPPADSPADRFEEFCDENPGACG